MDPIPPAPSLRESRIFGVIWKPGTRTDKALGYVPSLAPARRTGNGGRGSLPHVDSPAQELLGPIISFFRLVFGFIVLAVGSTLVILALVPLLPWRVARIYVCNFFGKTVGYSIARIAGVTPVVHHRERLNGSMPAIYVGTHNSSVDMFLSIWLCPYGGCGVLKKEVVRIPVFGILAALSGHLLIDRGNRDRAVEALASTGAIVKKHKLGIWIMPEGTRSRTTELLPFKKGFVHLAIATGLPIVPVVLHGAHRNWEAGKFQFTPITLHIDVLEPIDTSSWREETSGDHADAVRAVLADRLAKRAAEAAS